MAKTWQGSVGRRSFGAFQMIIGGLLLLVPLLASGLGLGDISVDSYLNQPLEATITVNSRPGEDLSGLEVSEASSADYQRLGLTYSRASVPLQFSVTDGPSGPQIQVTSELPVKDPVLQLAVEARWAKGRLLRPYTVFLDPATSTPSAPPSRRSSVESDARQPESSVTSPTASGETITPASRIDQRGSKSGSATMQDRFEDGEFGPVRSGETLWGIASRARGDSDVSMNRYMMAIQRLNPEAFNNGNINSLKRGAILRLPDSADLESIAEAEAAAAVQAQERAWRQGATATSESPALADSETTPALDPAGRIGSDEASASGAESDEPAEQSVAETTEPSDSADQQGSEPADELRLVPPVDDELLDESETAEQGEDQLRERLARAEEDLINANAEKAVLEERLSELEGSRQPGDTERGSSQAVGVQDQALADLQEEVRQQRQQGAESGQDDDTEPVAVADETGAEEAAAEPAESRRDRRDADTPLWKSPWLWIVGLVIILAGAFLWLRSRSEEDEAGTGSSFMDRMFKDEDTRTGKAEADSEDSVAALQQDAEELLRDLDAERDDLKGEESADEELTEEGRKEVDEGLSGTEAELGSEGPVERQEGASAVAGAAAIPTGAVAPKPEVEQESGEAAEAEEADEDIVEDEESDHPGSMDVDEDWARELKGEQAEEADSAAESAAEINVDDPFGASMEGGEDAVDVPEGEDSAEVKLDLARAYVGMNDREAAEAILEEVIAEGNENQQAEARRMLENL